MANPEQTLSSLGCPRQNASSASATVVWALYSSPGLWTSLRTGALCLSVSWMITVSLWHPWSTHPSCCPFPPPLHTLPRCNPSRYAALHFNLLKSLHLLSLQCLRRGTRPVVLSLKMGTRAWDVCPIMRPHSCSLVSPGWLVHAVLHRDTQGLHTCLGPSPQGAVGEN